jgi:hypothetical protein
MVRYLPRLFDSSAREVVPADLIGATIQNFDSMPEDAELDGGGLIVEYCPAGESTSKTIIFSFNELGMWIHSST